MRKSSVLFTFCAILAAAAGILYAHSAWKTRSSISAMERKAAMARYLQVTDLCLFTEARYTRHLSQADLRSPFQEHPVALDHFPSGSLVGPPAMLRKSLE